jgi:hypothetical protein
MAATKKRATANRAPTHPALRRAAELLAAPIDFDRLAADGVLREAGGWYEVLDPDRLPEHAARRIKALKPGNRVKFRKPSKRLGKFLRSAAEANGAGGTVYVPQLQ